MVKSFSPSIGTRAEMARYIIQTQTLCARQYLGRSAALLAGMVLHPYVLLRAHRSRERVWDG